MSCRSRTALFAAIFLFVLGVARDVKADSLAAADGQKKVLAGEYRGAISVLQSAASANSSDPAVFYWLGRAYYELKDYDNAATNAEKAVSLAPKNSEYHDWLGRAYGGKADRDHSFFVAKKVKSEFEDAVKLDPSNISARRDLEEYCIDAPWIAGGNKDEAQQQVDAIAAIDPVQGHAARAAFAAGASKKPSEAEAEYRAVLQGKSASLEPYFEAAGYFAGANKPDDIRSAADAAAAVGPNDPRVNFYRALADVLSVSNTGNAERDLKSYIASTPDRSEWPSHAAAREWLGRLYEAEGNSAAAAEQYRAALQLDPNRKDARNRLNKLEKNTR